MADQGLDPRLVSVVEGLGACCEGLRELERVSAPTMMGIAHALHSQGFDDYAKRVHQLALHASKVAHQTRGLIEQLDTLTDPRLEVTDPALPSP